MVKWTALWGGCYHLDHPQSWCTTLCRWSAIDYGVYIIYIRTFPPYLEAVSSIHNPKIPPPHPLDSMRLMFMYRHQNAEQNHIEQMAYKRLENVAKFRYFRTTVTGQNYVHEEINSRLNSENACYLSLENVLSSLFVSEGIKIKIYSTSILYRLF
jgi:hypothetical protein